jgi:hypothetical protein
VSDIIKFDFRGDALEVIEKEGDHYVVLARLCEPLGVLPKDQWDKLQKAAWADTRIIRATSEGAVSERELRCLSLRSIPMWLGSINSGKVKPELREKLALYQRECADVLADHFLGRRNPQASPRLLARVADLEIRLRLEEDANRVMASKVEFLDPTSTGLVGDARAKYIRAGIAAAAKNQARAEGNDSGSRVSSLTKTLDKELRQHVGHVEGIGWGWEALPLTKFGDAMAKLASITARAEKALRGASKKRDAGTEQLDLAPERRPGLVHLPIPKGAA